MTIHSSTPFLPQGARTWQVHDWPSWSSVRRHEALAPVLNSWLDLAGPARADRLAQMTETCGLLLLMAGQSAYQQCLLAPEQGEGFQWMATSDPLPWRWGAAPLTLGDPGDALGCPWSPARFWEWMDALVLPPDETGTLASLAWFHTLTGLLAWWESRLGHRLGNGFQTGRLDLGWGETHAITLTGRRYGPSLSSFK